MNPIDVMFRSLLRGFGWGLGRRAANRVPLWLVICVLVALWVVGGRG